MTEIYEHIMISQCFKEAEEKMFQETYKNTSGDCLLSNEIMTDFLI